VLISPEHNHDFIPASSGVRVAQPLNCLHQVRSIINNNYLIYLIMLFLFIYFFMIVGTNHKKYIKNSGSVYMGRGIAAYTLSRHDVHIGRLKRRK
jgi:hypothetical protein